MEHAALYRKYRPAAFADVIGQEHIVSVLEASLKKGSVAHAYLFVGSRGLGKTSVARIIAAELGTSANDIYEIDAASNRGIDDIRDLRENIRSLPFDSKYKVYIIDEVHMLTKEAFNALLKTLEEPPAHVIFILATTELEKVPETIVSRCQTFTFKKPSESILREVVRTTAEKENYELEDASLELIAVLGDGSFRDTLGILQKVLSSVGAKSGKTKGKISAQEVETVTGAPSSSLVNEYVSAIANSKIGEGMLAIKNASEQNLDMKVFMKLVLLKFRLALMLRYSPELKSYVAERVSGTDLALLTDLAQSKSPTLTSSSLITLLDCTALMRSAFIQQLPLELALWKILGGKE